jgi:predicted MPP superfamily phosphohydrolase
MLRPLANGRRRLAVWILLGCSLLLVPLVFFGRWLGMDPEFLDWLAWPAYLDMGVFLVLVPLLLARDLGWLVFRLVRRLHHGFISRKTVPQDIDRRRFLANAMNTGILGLTGGMTVAGYHEARRLARVREVDIPIKDLPDDLQGFHIVQISDLHLGPTIKGDYLQGIVDRCNILEPDLFAITGDLVDRLTWQLQAHVAPLEQLRSRHGSYFVTGNHEYYWDAITWTDLLRTLGITVLNNTGKVIPRGSARLLLAGVTDYAAGKYVPNHASDPQQARRGTGTVDAAVLLAHQPRSAFAGAVAGYDLQLSGHIHGGQFFPWNLFIGLVEPFDIGLHRVEDRMWLYVSAGTGYWGPPSRLGVPSEITSIRLVRA